MGLAVWQIFPQFPQNPSIPIATPTADIHPTFADKTPSATLTKRPTSTSNEIPAYVAAQMDIIEEDVVGIRGLSLEHPIERALLSPEQLEQRVLDDFLSDYTPEEARQDTITLAAFGLLEPNFDFLTLYKKLLTEQIAGFYDNEEKKMYVVQEQAFEGMQRMTYAHEFTHALQDAVYNFDDGLGFNDDSCEKESEKCAAIQALIEGDATLAELSWFQEYSTAEDKQQIRDFYNVYKSPVYDNAPEFLKKDFLFPYENGLNFVQWLYDAGGWTAVDNAYKNTPISTEQILHPEKYPFEQPIQITTPSFSSILDDDWVELDRGVMGEWYTYLILGYGIDPDGRINLDVASDAAEGWGGDSYVVYHNDAQAKTIMVIQYTWDTVNDANEFSDAFQEYAGSRFGSPIIAETNQFSWQDVTGYNTLHSKEQNTTWIFAPDAELGQAIWDALKDQ
jgi:hypothetical protein